MSEICLYDPVTEIEGLFSLKDHAVVEELTTALAQTFDAPVYGFEDAGIVYPISFLIKAPSFFNYEPSKRRLKVLFKPSERPQSRERGGSIHSSGNDISSSDDDESNSTDPAQEGVYDEEAYDEFLVQQDEDNVANHNDAAVAFRILDLHSLGLLHREDIVAYLTAAYGELIDNSTDIKWTISPKKLALATMLDLWQQSGTRNDDPVSFEDFRAWYMNDIENEARDVMIQAINFFEMKSSSVSESDDGYYEGGEYENIHIQGSHSGLQPPSSPTYSDDDTRIGLKDAIEEVRTLTGLGVHRVKDVVSLFTAHISDSVFIDKTTFDSCFNYLRQSSGKLIDVQSNQEVDQFLSLLYNIFDTDASGLVNVLHLCRY
jgi:hypothetical protein